MSTSPSSSPERRSPPAIRFLRRCDLPDHHWKFSANDVRERAHWDAYQKAFSETLSHISTTWAPWHVIPADRKWFARIAAASAIMNAMIEIDPQFPTVEPDALEELADAKAELEAEAPTGEPRDPVADQLSKSSDA